MQDLTSSIYGGIIPTPIAFRWDISLKKAFEECTDWETEIKAIRSAQPDDIVHIQMSGPGGSAEVMKDILSAMNQCQCRIVGEVTGGIGSALTFIFLNCDDWIVNSDATFMAHSGEVGYGEKPTNFMAFAEHYKSQHRALFTKYYKGFFTEEEIEEIITNNKDFWIEAPEIQERLDNLVAYREQVMDQSMDDEFVQVDESLIVPRDQYSQIVAHYLMSDEDMDGIEIYDLTDEEMEIDDPRVRAEEEEEVDDSTDGKVSGCPEETE